MLLPLVFLPHLAASQTQTQHESIPLRILPAGASVTYGVGSPSGSSYRLPLRSLLVPQHSVNYVGTHRHGNFTDNDLEATSGFVLSQIANATLAAAEKFLPNLVIIEAGTNDCNRGRNASPVDIAKNFTEMVRGLFRMSPGVTVLSTTLLVNPNEDQDFCRKAVNLLYQDAAKIFVTEGARFGLVDMRDPEGPTVQDLADGRHPNDKGYKKMADVWKRGIDDLVGRGVLTKPADNGIPWDGDVRN